jgi:hypothetical protein
LQATQGDSLRQINGRLGAVTFDSWADFESQGDGYAAVATGAFGFASTGYHYDGEVGHSEIHYDINFSSSYVTPTSNEIRPVNIAVRYMMRARP